MVSHKCNECSFASKRSDNLKRHLKNVHGIAKKIVVPINPSNAVRHLRDGLPRRLQRAEPEDGLYTKKEFEETMETFRYVRGFQL